MKFSKSFQVLNIAVFAALTMSSVAMAVVRQEFAKTDQPFVFFKALAGAKYPTLTKVDPAKNQMDIVLCGAQTKNGDVKLIKKAKEIKNMVAIRFTMNFAETGLKMDKRYEGCREAYGDIALFRLMKLIGLLSSENYKGTVLVDEYLQGLPMKIVLSNKEQFDALKTYLVTNFAAQEVVPAKQKPLLLLNILDNNAQLSEEDNEFLNEYFEVLDPCAAETKAFFDNAQKNLFDMIDKTKGAKNVGESFGEATIRQFEEMAKDFESKKIGGLVTTAFFGGLGAFAYAQLTAPLLADGKGNPDNAGVVVKIGSDVAAKFKGLFLNQDGSINKTAVVITAAIIVSIPVLMHILFDVSEDMDDVNVANDADVQTEEESVVGQEPVVLAPEQAVPAQVTAAA